MLVCHTLPGGVFFFFPICIAAGHVGKTLYTKTLRTAKTSPLVLFFVRPSSNVELFITKLLQLSTRKDWRLNQLSLTYLIWLDPCAHGNSDLGATSTDFHVPNLMHKWLSFIFTGNRWDYANILKMNWVRLIFSLTYDSTIGLLSIGSTQTAIKFLTWKVQLLNYVLVPFFPIRP